MNNLVYYVYGADQYVRQTLFSIMSALRFEASTNRPWRIIIYTDNPDPYRDLNATLEYLDADRMREWAGQANFGHRRKIFALQHSLETYGPSVLLDCDTYFRKSPRRLFARMGPGNIIMHLCEARFDRLSHPDAVALAQGLCSAPFSVCDQLYGFTMKSLMWNSGVVGLHTADAHLIEQVICLSDAIYQRSLTPSSGKAAAWCALSEQVAWSQVLAGAARVQECGEGSCRTARGNAVASAPRTSRRDLSIASTSQQASGGQGKRQELDQIAVVQRWMDKCRNPI